MHPKFILFVSIFVGLVTSHGTEEEWSYEEEELLGPSHWRDAFKMCGHVKQSPIDISSPVIDRTLERLVFHGYDQMPKTVSVRHDGHTIKVFPDVDMSISGGNLNFTFKFHDLHFHWGDNDTMGSEHTFDGHTYPLEIHFVHWNSEKYANISEASDKEDGLAVVGLLVTVVPDNSPLLNEALGDLTKSFAVIHYAGNETRATPFKFIDLFPKNLQYYRYQGSLTTPPCLETVTWTIIKDPVFVTHEQAEEFRRFHEEHHPEREMHHSNRPIQPLNQRKLSLSEPFYDVQFDHKCSYEGKDSVCQSQCLDVFKLCDPGNHFPVDILSPIPDNNLGRLFFHGYDQTPVSVTLRYDGNAVKVFTAHEMSISGGNLNHTFVFHHLHFHWGGNDASGSEHTVNGHSYPLEVHFIHWNSEKYASLSEASNKEDGLAAVGLLVNVAPNDSPLLNKVLGNLTKSLAYVNKNGNETNVTPFKFLDLFPSNLQYYRYQGSLTTSPCLETVAWSIVKDPVYVTQDQAEEFRRFHAQSHNGRTFYVSEAFSKP